MFSRHAIYITSGIKTMQVKKINALEFSDSVYSNASQNLWRTVRAKVLNSQYFSAISPAVKH